MRWSYNLERSYGAALWLFVVAALVVAMVLVGGATRLTGSGLSITEWRPVTGAVPPLTHAGWLAEFAKYQRIPQYQLVNRGLSLGAFQSLYWWEWGHRLLARLVGLAILLPLAFFLWTGRIPRRLRPRAVGLLGLVALEGLIGWWMVASGLSARVSVAPERLATHLTTALLIFSLALWTGLEAWFGRARAPGDRSRPLALAASGLVALAFLQIVLGALVAGNHAGRVDTDWPLMGGRIFPSDYAPAHAGIWTVIAHNAASVQLHHRLTAYLLLAAGLGLGGRLLTSAHEGESTRALAAALIGALLLQVALGIATLMAAAPLGLSLVHQAGAVLVLGLCLALAWRVRRA